MLKFLLVAFIIPLILLSCAKKEEKSTLVYSNTNSINEDIKYVTIETNKGVIKAELYVGKAPITTQNFIGLASSGFYNGLKFHRVEPGFVIQTGDPKGDGTGGSGKSVQLEINNELKHVKGAFGMARTDDPNSATSQFYITLAEVPFLDGKYAVFGKVIEGMEMGLQPKL